MQKAYHTLRDNWGLVQCDRTGTWSEEDVEAHSKRFLKGDTYGATMPAQVHDILCANAVIRDPREIGACEECLWVAQKDWAYHAQFDKPMEGQRQFLHFHGLDTVADIYLNGTLIASHKDGFLPLRIEITDCITAQNSLLLHFYAPEPWLAADPQTSAFIKAGGAPNKAIRKAVEDFGFFNGPKPSFTPIGIYAPVVLESVGAGEIRHLEINQEFPGDDLTRAQLKLSAEIAGDPGLEIQWQVREPQGETLFQGAGDSVVEIVKPALWYPHTHGEQPLYTVTARLISAGEVIDEQTRRIGLRKVVRSGDFAFTVNGLHVKLWGANLTPLPVPSHVVDPDMLRTTLDRVIQARMPVIRIWGPSQPWPDLLVEEADRRGILLWMEFAHTGRGYPAEEWFYDLCRAEARNWVQRWKHAPSILFWSGGNEAYLGLETAEPAADSPERELFDRVYRQVVESLDPQRWYIPNSPFGGEYGNDPREGDCHVRDYQIFQPGHEYAILPSENIRLTIALAKTLKRHFGEDLAWPEDGFTGARTRFNDPAIPESWMAITPNTFWANVRVGCQGQMFDADGSPESLIFKIGAGCATFIRQTVERLRRGRPARDAGGPRRCQGYQWWKFNDTFPMIYASLIDDQLEPNLPFYALRRAYAPVQVSTEIDEDGLHFWVVNDSAAPVEGTLRIRRLDFTGLKTLASLEFPVEIAQGESRPVGTGAPFQAFERSCPIFLELLAADSQTTLAEALCYLAPERELWFPEDAKLILRFEEPDTLIVTSDKIARWVELQGATPDGDEFGWYFEDNFFDLLPGRAHRVRILGNHRQGTIQAHSRYSPHTRILHLPSR